MTNDLIKALEKRKGKAETILEKHKIEFPQADHFFAKGVIAGLQESISISASHYAQTDREKIATAALQGLCANYLREGATGWSVKTYAVEAVELADALIVELNKRE